MTVTGIISAIIIGAIIGIIGRLLVRGRQNISWWLTILIGIIAALLGTFIASLFNVKDTGGIDWIELILQIVLAAVGVSLVARRRGRIR